METSSEKKIDITKKILEIEDLSVLNKIEQILEEVEIVAYTSEGKPLTREEYIERIENISREVEAGETSYRSEEVKDHVKNRPQ
jgi:hypothetical protein